MTDPDDDFGLDLPRIAERRAAAMHEMWSRSMMTVADLDNALQRAFDEDVRALTWLLMEVRPEMVRKHYAGCFDDAWFTHRAQTRLQ